MRLRDLPLALAALLLAPSPAQSFYLPGVAPTNYKMYDKVPLTVNTLTPSQSEQDARVRSVFAFDYYHPSFHFCQPENGAKQISESLGSILFGDRILTSPFDLHMGRDQKCVALCGEQTFDGRDGKFTNRRILQNYNINWNIDGLPAAQRMADANGNIFYQPGFLLGSRMNVDGKEDQPVINNHYNIYVDFHQAGKEKYRVVGVLVEPASVRDNAKAAYSKDETCAQAGPPMILSETDPTNVVFTYSVYWQESSTSFATRWDKYLHVYDPKIHWFSLVNSAVIVLFLIGMISTILLRTLRKDIARYNRLDEINLDDFSGNTDDSVQEDSGWKLVHGDVFRPPKNPMLLSVLLGNGAQLFMMVGFTIAFALLGFLSPSNRGSLATVMILLYTLFGFVGGYVSSRTYKFFQGEAWKRTFAYTPVVIPGFVFSMFFLLNLFVWARQSSGAVPFTTMLVIVGIWFVISVPLSITGSWLGFRSGDIAMPVRTNQIPRQIPPATGYLRPLPSMLLVGILPFGAIFVELYFIMSSIWFSRIYYMFGFLFLCYGLMIVTSAAVTVLMIYFLLCSENYHWQWRSFFTSGASSGYVFAYAMLYWIRTLSFSSWTSGVLYLGYSLLISTLWFVLTGTIGFFASWAFVHRIYGSIKID